MLKSLSKSISSFVVMSTSVVTSQVSIAQMKTGEETILRFERNEKEAIFHVRSGGCTKKSDFGLMVLDSAPLTLKLIRIRPDHCKANLPQGIAITYNNKEIAALSFSHSKDTFGRLILANTIEEEPSSNHNRVIVQQNVPKNNLQHQPLNGLHRVSSPKIQMAK